MSKLTEAKATLETALADLEAYQKGQLKRDKLQDVLRFFATVRDEHDALDETRKKINAIIEGMSRKDIPDLMEDEGVTTMTVDGQRYSVSQRYSASMVDKMRGMDWLRKEGHGDLITETVNSSSLASFAKAHAEERGVDLPADLFKVNTMKYTSVTKAK